MKGFGKGLQGAEGEEKVAQRLLYSPSTYTPQPSCFPPLPLAPLWPLWPQAGE